MSLFGERSVTDMSVEEIQAYIEEVRKKRLERRPAPAKEGMRRKQSEKDLLRDLLSEEDDD